MIAALVPLVALGGIAAARSRAGPALVAGLCAAGLVAYVGVEANAAYQRDDWRGVAAALGPLTAAPRVVLVNPPSGALALEYYLPLRTLTAPAISPREIDVVGAARASAGGHPPCSPTYVNGRPHAGVHDHPLPLGGQHRRGPAPAPAAEPQARGAGDPL